MAKFEDWFRNESPYNREYTPEYFRDYDHAPFGGYHWGYEPYGRRWGYGPYGGTGKDFPSRYGVGGYYPLPSKTDFGTMGGIYSGRGPRNYGRSDSEIREDVCNRLAAHGQIDASDVEVSVDDCQVTLQGTVDSRRTKRLAETIADSVFGVEDVHNRLTIRRVNTRTRR